MKRNLLTTALFSSLITAAFALDMAQATPLLSGWQAAIPGQRDIVQIGERFDRKPPPEGAQPVIRTPDASTNAIVTNLVAEFEKAAGSANHVLTKQAALDSNWGWAADHFDAIDRQKKGAVSLDDVLTYVSQTARIALPRRAASTQTMQIVH
jgi:hypothetical protein